METYRIEDLARLTLGRLDESNVITVRIDMSAWAADMPNMRAGIWNTRYKEILTPYPVMTRMEGNTLIWTVTNHDTEVEGTGVCTILAFDGENKVRRSRDILTVVDHSEINVRGDEKPQYFPWAAEVLTARDEAIAAAVAAERIKDEAEAAVAAEGAKQIADIIRKGRETLASVPEDYAMLSGLLKEQRENLDVNLGGEEAAAELTVKATINENGTYTEWTSGEGTTWRSAATKEYIPVKGNVLHYSGKLKDGVNEWPYIAHVAQYRAENTGGFIKRVTMLSVDREMGVQTREDVALDPECKFVRLSFTHYYETGHNYEMREDDLSDFGAVWRYDTRAVAGMIDAVRIELDVERIRAKDVERDLDEKIGMVEMGAEEKANERGPKATITCGFELAYTIGRSDGRAGPDAVWNAATKEYVPVGGTCVAYTGNWKDANGTRLGCDMHQYDANKNWLNKRVVLLESSTGNVTQATLDPECAFVRFKFYHPDNGPAMTQEIISECFKAVWWYDTKSNAESIRRVDNAVADERERAQKAEDAIRAEIGNGSGIIFYDDFDRDMLDLTKWSADTSGRHDPALVDFVGGHLRVRAQKQQDGSWKLGRVTSARKFAFGPHVQVSVRAKVTSAHGAWNCIWTRSDNFVNHPARPAGMDDSPWPMGGEIDMVEHIGGYSNCSLHYLNTAYDPTQPEGTGNKKDAMKTARKAVDDTEWHVYTYRNDGVRLQLLVDGNAVLDADAADPAFVVDGFDPFGGDQAAHYLMLGMQVGDGSAFAPAPTADDPDEYAMLIDYVKAEAIGKVNPTRWIDAQQPNGVVVERRSSGAYKMPPIRPRLDPWGQNRTIQYQVRDETVCTINSEGKVVAVSPGQTVVYAMGEACADRFTVTVEE